MTDLIREAVRLRMQELGINQTQLAKELGTYPGSVSRAINGLPGGGELPLTWQRILDKLDLEIVVQRKNS